MAFDSLHYLSRVTLPFTGNTCPFSHKISIMYTYTSGLAFCPLNVPFHPEAGSLTATFFLSNTICPQRLNTVSDLTVNNPVPLTKKVSLCPSPFGEKVFGTKKFWLVHTTLTITSDEARQPYTSV